MCSSMAARCIAETSTPVEEEGDEKHGVEASGGDGLRTPPATRAKKLFSLSCVPVKRAPPPIPTIKDIRLGSSTFLPPSKLVSAKLGPPGLAIGIDVETAGWEYKRGDKSWIGQFGHYGFCPARKLQAGRVVHLGWVIGRTYAVRDTVIETRKE